MPLWNMDTIGMTCCNPVQQPHKRRLTRLSVRRCPKPRAKALPEGSSSPAEARRDALLGLNLPAQPWYRQAGAPKSVLPGKARVCARVAPESLPVTFPVNASASSLQCQPANGLKDTTLAHVSLLTMCASISRSFEPRAACRAPAGGVGRCARRFRFRRRFGGAALAAQCVELLGKYEITLDESTLKQLEEASMSWEAVKKKMFNVREMLSNEQQSEARQIRETSDLFQARDDDNNNDDNNDDNNENDNCEPPALQGIDSGEGHALARATDAA